MRRHTKLVQCCVSAGGHSCGGGRDCGGYDDYRRNECSGCERCNGEGTTNTAPEVTANSTNSVVADQYVMPALGRSSPCALAAATTATRSCATGLSRRARASSVPPAASRHRRHHVCCHRPRRWGTNVGRWWPITRCWQRAARSRMWRTQSAAHCGDGGDGAPPQRVVQRLATVRAHTSTPR